MAEKNKKTIYVGGLPPQVDASMVHSAFSVFGDIVDVQLPKDAQSDSGRGFAFLTFSSNNEAEDAIDNMHLNELGGESVELTLTSATKRIISVNLAKAPKTSAKGGFNKAVWEDEEWIQEHAAPIGDGAPDPPAPDDA